MPVAEPGVWCAKACLRTAGQAIRGLADLLLETSSEVPRRRLLFWLRHLSRELLAELQEERQALSTFDLLSTVDEAVRAAVSQAGRPNLVLALIADQPLPGLACGPRARLLGLIHGLLDSAIRTTDSSELLLEATVMREDVEHVELCFLVTEDFTRIGSRTLAPLSPGSFESAEGQLVFMTGLGIEAGDPASLWVSVLLRKPSPSARVPGA